MKKKNVQRFDVSNLSNSAKTQQGFLRVPAFATRTGVFKYRKADGSLLRELRLPEEVFSEESMASLAGVPVTNNHPKGTVDSTNAKALMVGFTGDTVDRVDDKIQVPVTITDEETIQAIESGKQEVSCGYLCDHEDSSGVWEGEPYDLIQRNIRYNHLAVVGKGRAGSEVRLRLDSDAAMVAEEQDKEKNMKKISMNGVEFEVSPELAAAYEAHMAKMQGEMDGMKKELEGSKKESVDAKAAADEKGKAMEAVQAKADALQKDLDAAKAKADAGVDEKLINERVKARMKVMEVATAKLSDTTKLDEMTDLEIKKAVIKTDSPDVDLDKKAEAYIEARFDYIVEQSGKEVAKKVGAGVHAARKDSATRTDSSEARKKSMEAASKAWQQPLATHIKQ